MFHSSTCKRKETIPSWFCSIFSVVYFFTEGRLQETPGRHYQATVIIDLKGLAFMDTYAAKVLVTLHKFAWKKKKKFLLKNVSPEFKEIIDLLKLEKDFKIIED